VDFCKFNSLLGEGLIQEENLLLGKSKFNVKFAKVQFEFKNAVGTGKNYGT